MTSTTRPQQPKQDGAISDFAGITMLIIFLVTCGAIGYFLGYKSAPVTIEPTAILPALSSQKYVEVLSEIYTESSTTPGDEVKQASKQDIDASNEWLCGQTAAMALPPNSGLYVNFAVNYYYDVNTGNCYTIPWVKI